MSISFLTPRAALVGLGVLVPLAAFVLVEWRAARVRSEVHLAGPSPLTRLPLLAALLAVAGLFSLASAQPLLQRSRMKYARTDAAAYVVIDTSRSMLAAEGFAKPTRFARAKRAALALREAIPEVPVGLASMTDRVLPHVFPTVETNVFHETLARTLGIERPPPSSTSDVRTTDYGALSALANQRFFPPGRKRRLVIVLTDGESIPLVASYLRELYFTGPHIQTIFVRFWSETERVYSRKGRPEPQYRPDPASGRQISQVARTMGGKLFSEAKLGDAIRTERALVGSGVKVKVRNDRRPMVLAPFSVLAAVFPLGFLLWRRNL